MEQIRFDEMMENYIGIKDSLDEKQIFIFGHCEASLSLADVLMKDGYRIKAILDNNPVKRGIEYKGVSVVNPEEIMEYPSELAVVLIVTRFYESMYKQLRELGFNGAIRKLVEYNSYAEYSFSQITVDRKKERLNLGQEFLTEIREENPGKYIVICPFNALGDVYFCLSYLPHYLEKNRISNYMVLVPSNGCRKVAELFGVSVIKVIEQKKLDSIIQAVIYENAKDAFIAHQDRPYIIGLHKALRVKRITLEDMYCCGVFGLPPDSVPFSPTQWRNYDNLSIIDKGRAVILSPYAKSVIALPDKLWKEITEMYIKQGCQVFTNVSGDEKALPGTEPLSVSLLEMKSVVEYAGTFVGIRSGLCDVISTADCKKVALYPDYNYGDTQWKAIEMYSINGFENLVVKDDKSCGDILRRLAQDLAGRV